MFPTSHLASYSGTHKARRWAFYVVEEFLKSTLLLERRTLRIFHCVLIRAVVEVDFLYTVVVVFLFILHTIFFSLLMQ